MISYNFTEFTHQMQRTQAILVFDTEFERSFIEQLLTELEESSPVNIKRVDMKSVKGL